MLIPYAHREHDLDGYGGTWSRTWRLGLLFGPFSVGFRISFSRHREKD